MRLIDADLLASRLEDIAPAEWSDGYEEGASDAITRAQEMIENAPTVELPRWIPVTEKLPKDDITVLITFNGIVIDGYIDGGIWFWIGDSKEIPTPPTHWMPLPEPPKEVKL